MFDHVKKAATTMRYSARLHELRQRGYGHEMKCERGCWYYRGTR